MKNLHLCLCLLIVLQGCGGSDSSDNKSSASAISSSIASSSISSSSSSSISSSTSSNSSAPPEGFPVGTAETIPTLTITTEGNAPIISKDDYLNASVNLKDEDGLELLTVATEVKGRGNSTWDMPKKPYRLKFTTSSSLLGMPANKHWVLLANYSDKTLMRNDVTFHLSRRLGMEYTPRSHYVDLMVNGTYQGVYQLTEHIRIGTERVNIPELKVGDTAAEVISGGYLLEIDFRRGEDFCIDSAHTQDLVFCIGNPEDLLAPEWIAQREYIENYINASEAAIYADNFTDTELGYAAYIDVDSAINYYLINELFKNVDGNLRLSTFLFKKRNGKLTFGPIWDFDLAIGNVDYGNADITTGWHIRTAPWFTKMFSDPAFKTKVNTRWAELKDEGILEELFAYIDARALWLEQVQEKNFETWPILGTYVWPNRVVTGSYGGEVTAMKDWLRERLDWMDEELKK